LFGTKEYIQLIFHYVIARFEEKMGVNGGVEKGKKDSNAYWIVQSGRFRNSSIWDSFIILANSKWVGNDF